MLVRNAAVANKFQDSCRTLRRRRFRCGLILTAYLVLFAGGPSTLWSQGTEFEGDQNVAGAVAIRPLGIQFYLEHIEGDGISLEDEGFTTGSIFLPYQSWDTVFFLDAGGSLTNEGRGIINAGFGLREYLPDLNRVLGASAWWTTDGGHQGVFTSLGFSWELLGEDFDVRGSISFPVLDKNQLIDSNVVTALAAANPRFVQNLIIADVATSVITTQQLEANTAGGDVEIGIPFRTSAPFDINLFSGLYHYQTPGSPKIWGGSLRLEVQQLFPNVDAQAIVTYDRTFGTSFGFGITKTFGQPPQISVYNKMWSRVRRKKRLVVLRQVQRNVFGTFAPNSVLTNNNAVITVTHVNDNPGAVGLGGGDVGTFENPNTSLTTAAGSTNNIVYVHGNSTFTNQFYVLAAGQQFLGEGNNNPHIITTDQIGPFVMPNVAGAGSTRPLINAAPGNAITANANTVISNFTIMNPAMAGISATGLVGAGSTVNVNRTTIIGGVNGVNITGSGGQFTFDAVAINNSTADGVNLAGNAGSIAFNGGSIDGTAGDAIHSVNTSNLSVSGVNIGLNSAIAGDGIDVENSDGVNRTVMLTNNMIGSAASPITGRGIVGTVSGTGNLTITANNNVVVSNGDAVRGTNTSTGTLVLNLDGNTLSSLNGIGVNLGTASATVGPVNFTAATLNNGPIGGVIPPDTMGAVGPAHIVVLINDRFIVFDKNGNQLSTQSLDNFIVVTGGLPLTANFSTFDPRIIFDPSSGRWFAIVLEADINGVILGSNILIAVSNSNDPTAGWSAFRIIGDLQGDRFVDFDMLGLDADGVYISTNNFNAAGFFADISVYSIPKADLVGGLGIVNLTRFENLPLDSNFQPVVDFGPSDARGAFLNALFDGGGGNATLLRMNVIGAGAANATLSAVTNIAVTPYLGPPDGRQPGGAPDLDNEGEFDGNVVEVGDSIFGVHAVRDAAGNSAIRFYEINETNNAVVQDILISDANLDLLYPTVAVNANGDVVIGFTGTGVNQFASSMAIIGATAGGVTTFGTPLVLQPGVNNYNVTFGFGLNRWGDYSATVVDPVDANKFWAFQEFVSAQNEWAVQVTEINVNVVTASGPITLNASNNTMILPGFNPRSFSLNANTAAGNITVFGLNNTAVDGVGAALTTGNRGNGVDEFEVNGGQVNGSLDVNGVIIGF